MLELEGGSIIWKAPDEPAWVAEIRTALLR
jgi:hypothetical protein